MEAPLGEQLNAFGVKLPFQRQSFFADRIEGVPGVYLKSPLPDDRTGVLSVVNKMYRAPADPASISEGIAVPVDTGKRRQQRRVDGPSRKGDTQVYR